MTSNNRKNVYNYKSEVVDLIKVGAEISVAAAIGMPPIAVAGAVAGLVSYGLNKFFRGKSKKKRSRNRRAR